VRAISIKAFVIANFAYFVLSIISGFIVALVAAEVLWAGLKSATLVASLIFAGAILPTAIGVGYIAARIAGRSYLLNGALSSSVWVLVRISDLTFGIFDHPSSSDIPHAASLVLEIMICGSPLLGVAGGYLARQLDARRTARGLLAPEGMPRSS
jgi:hypothetical protein